MADKDEIRAEDEERMKKPHEDQVDDSQDDEDEAEDDGQDEHNEETRKKKKRKRRESERNYVLDEDDSELLKESHISVSHPKLHMSRKHDTTWDIDIPERMQISEESTGHPPTDEFSIKKEAEWIYNELFSGMAPLFNRSGATTEEVDDELKCDIARFLELMHVQKLDVPFIAMYRKEEILSLLEDPMKSEADFENYPNQKPKLKWHEVLWTIQDLDRKWLLLQKRKSALHSCYTECFQEESRGIYDETRLRLNEQIFESITNSLKVADSEREVDDVDLKFNLHFPSGEVIQDESLKGQSHYRVCNKAGLSEVASKFGYRSEQFGSQISLQKMRLYELEDAEEMPEGIASNFTCAMFETPEDVLKGARHMAAVEISVEPCIRKHVRRIFMDNALVSTSPTPDGNTAVDCFHQFSGVKWLREKPLSRFEDAEWLLIQKVVEEKLVNVTIKLPEVVLDKLIIESNDYYLSDGDGNSAQLWNEQRKLILQDAFHNFLIPSMEKESRLLLTSRAKMWVRREYGKLLWDKVSIAPENCSEVKEDDVSVDLTTAPRVMACCWGPGNPATTFVMLDSLGEVLEVRQAGSLQQFIMDHKPHAVVLGAANLGCRQLKDEILEGISRVLEDHHICIGFFFSDESLPHVYENSSVSVDQLPLQEGIIRRAVALGRYYQYPLAMVATLCGPSREILSWELSSFESFLTPDEKYGMVEQVMVDVTNQVGLDIDLACRHEWLFAPLQFISGLGPVKAASLQRSLVGVGAFRSREDLKTHHGLGNNVFKNAVGFLPVLDHKLPSYTNILDNTRIHPESYGIAQDLAKNIARKYRTADDFVAELAIKHVREKPYLLRTVDVD